MIPGQRTVAHFMGSQIQFHFDPGAYAPGFMLSPAPQAEADFLCKAFLAELKKVDKPPGASS